MTKQEILEYFKDIDYCYNECSRYDDLNRMLDELIEDTRKQSGINLQVIDEDELQRSVDKAEEKIKTGIIAVFIDDLKEIYEKLWDVKISAPNIIEHREHYKQIQDVTEVVTEKLKKYQEAESEEY
jgi:FtsZ-interacting cell division protein YlmF